MDGELGIITGNVEERGRGKREWQGIYRHCLEAMKVLLLVEVAYASIVSVVTGPFVRVQLRNRN
jgi:hypothetical protein